MASCSVVALLVGGGVPAAFAQCATSITGNSPGCTNSATITGINIHSASVTGSIFNYGTISPNGISINTDSTVSAPIQEIGTLAGGISIDSTSKVTATSEGAVVISGESFSGGITNAGYISVATNGVLAGVLLDFLSTFTGGVTNTGTISSAAAGVFLYVVSTFGGNISNQGTITAGGAGIIIGSAGTATPLPVLTFAGDITNSGTINAQIGILLNLVSTFVGDVTNSGTISASRHGIAIFGTVSTFLGSISNSGIISSASDGIQIGNVSTFSGGIKNSGTISAVSLGILISPDSTFNGGISNGGMIAAGRSGIVLSIVSTFGGGITNGGTISAGVHDILISNVSSFGGGITNNGALLVESRAILITSVSSFGGGINNTGTISSSTGSGVHVINDSTLSGGITNSGTITAGTNGIQLQRVSTVGGGITNSGTISSEGYGIQLKQLSTFSGGVYNSGLISGIKTAMVLGGVAGTALGLPTPILSFSGGISNSGTILSATGGGMGLNYISAFNGGITNSGLISVPDGGINLSAISIFSGGITNGGTISAGVDAIVVGTVSTFGGGIMNGGTIAAGANGIVASTLSTFGGGITNGGAIIAGGTAVVVSSVSTFMGNVSNGGIISANDRGINIANVSTFMGNISNSGNISGTRGISILGSTISGSIIDSGTILASFRGIGIGAPSGGTNTSVVSSNTGIHVSGPTFTGGIVNNNGGTISAGAKGIFVGTSSHASVTVSTFSGGITNAGVIVAKTGIVVGPRVATFLGAISNSGNITGTGGIAIDVSAAGNAITIDQSAGTVAGAIKLSPHSDVLNVTGGSIAGSIIGSGSLDTVNFGPGFTGTYGGNPAFAISGIEALNIASGSIVLDATANSAAEVTVTGGTLQIGDVSNPDAQLTATSVDVTDAGILSGHGTLSGAVTIGSGGTLAPGGTIGTLAINGGPLIFNSGSLYGIELSPTQHSLTSVIGTPGKVTINGGSVVLTPHIGSYGATTVPILTSTGLLSGMFSPTILYTGTTRLNGATLSYDNNDVYLSYAQSFAMLSLAGETINEQNVASAINNFVLGGGTLPNGFQNLASLSGPALYRDLSALSGEVGADAERGAFDLMSQFLNLMLDPFVDGRGGFGPSGPATSFAPEQPATLPADIALAYASVFKAPSTGSFAQRWGAWGASFGGSEFGRGDPVVGSTNITTGGYGFAAGMDYRYSPDTVLGFALAGGGTNWGLEQGLGAGRSEAFLAGVYGATHSGPAYVGGALAFANNWFSTSRSALGDQLTANFQGQSYGARFEGGYRIALPAYLSAVGVTPYAALQAQDLHTPGYSESDPSGGGFGLSYASRYGGDVRGELGARFDDPTLFYGKPLVMRVRLAWAYDWVATPSGNAAFESLPDTNFTAFGAPIPHSSALASAGAQLFLTSTWSFTAKFDGEFASGGQTYGGSGTLRYAW